MPLDPSSMLVAWLAAGNDKSQYTLFNPTPRELWRPLSPDRPDFTESPYTVDAGAMQIESSFFGYTKEGSSHAWSVAPTNLKLGLLNTVDFQFLFDPYLSVSADGDRADGFGDITFRLKANLWGNDEGPTALGVMPFLQVPTSADGVGSDRVQGGIIVPFAVEITERIGLGLMYETDFVWDPEDNSYDTEFIGSGSMSFELTEQVGVFLEGIATQSTDPSLGFNGFVGFGATYRPTDNLQFDVGTTIGLTGVADDIEVFAGITVRF